jgi:hypothetical protein
VITSAGLGTHSALIACLMAGTAASAERLELLGPSGLVSSDGFAVGVLIRRDDGRPAPAEGAVLEAEGGAVKPEGLQGPVASFHIAPRPAAKEIRVRARSRGMSAKRTFALGPPAVKVALSLGSAAPVKNRDTAAPIDVRILRADGSLDPESPPPVLRANVGRVEGLERVGPGHFRARYILPGTRYPEVAVLVAFAPWPHPDAVLGAIGTLLVPLASAIDLPGHTEPNAQMSIEIAGTHYGPVRARSDGRFQLPVVVPPGHRYGKGTAVDRAGNKRATRVDLLLPPTDQLACVVNPSRLPADGRARARVVCATSDPFGAPQPNVRVELAASAGERGPPRSLGDGLVEWLFTAPAQVGAGRVDLTAVWREGRSTSREEMQVELAQGPAAALALSPSGPVAHFGGPRMEFEARVHDALGRPRPGATILANSSLGGLSAVAPKDGGRSAFSWTPPASGSADRLEVVARAFGPTGTLPSRIVAWTEGDAVWVATTDLAGLPVPEQPLRVGERVVQTGEDGVARIGALAPGAHEIHHPQWTGLRLTLHALAPGLVWPSGARPAMTAEQRLEIPIAPPIPVNVRLAIAGRDVTWWAEDAHGRLLGDRKLAVHVEGGDLGRTRRVDGRTSATVAGRGRAQISVADVETGVTAIAEIPP